MPDARPRRRRPRRSLGALMLAIAATGVGLGLLAIPARRQRLAVEAIRASGGQVAYADEFIGGIYRPGKGEVPGPAWLRRWIGDDYFRTARGLYLRPRTGAPPGDRSAGPPREPGRASADLMAHVGNLDRVELLQFDQGLTVDDAGLARLAGLRSIKRLALVDASGLTGSGFEALRGLAAVERIELIRADRLTDDGLAAIGRLPGLAALFVSGAPGVTDSGVASLAGKSSLTILTLETPNLTDEGLGSIATMTGLTAVRLGDGSQHGARPRPAGAGRITDAGIARILRLPALGGLTVHGTEVTARGLRAALDAPRLAWIELSSRAPMGGGLDGPNPSRALNSLWLRAPDLGDEAVVRAANWAGLASLKIQGGGRFSDRSIEAARGLPGLATIGLGAFDAESRSFGVGEVTDSGLANLAKVPSLRVADLRGALPGPISPAGLAALRSNPTLRAVALTAEQVRPADLAALRRARPGLRIELTPAAPPRGR